MKKSAVVICPGRGTYNREELGYLKRYHDDKADFIQLMDDYRQKQGQAKVSDLDAENSYRNKIHNTGDNASALIYCCAMADFMSIDRNKYDITAVTGNSMGWYIALAASGASDSHQGMKIVNTMGSLMHHKAKGGQLIFPLCDDNWQFDPALKATLDNAMEQLSKDFPIFHSIDLGLMAVIASDDEGIKALANKLPRIQQRYPLILPNHAAFHTPLMQSISSEGKSVLGEDLISAPTIPLIDGCGRVWQPYSTERNQLYKYTFEQQVCETYKYSKAIEVVCKEFAPDCLIILGPGSTLGAPTAQQLIKMRWRNIDSKAVFKASQETQPFVLSMGIESQRQQVIT